MNTFIFNLAFCFEFTVVILFWTVLAPQASEKFAEWDFVVGNVIDHAIIGSIIFCELFFNAMQFKKHNYYILLTVAILYFPNNYMWYKMDDEAVYPGLTFDNLMTVAFISAGFILTTLAFYLGNKFTEKYKKQRIKQVLERLEVIEKISSNNSLSIKEEDF